MKLALYEKADFGELDGGVALIEFVIVLPLLFFFTVAVVDLSRWINRYAQTNHVTYEGARYAAGVSNLSVGAAIVDPGSSDVIPSVAHGQIITRIQRIMQEQGMQSDQAQIRIERIDPAGENSVQISLQLPFQPISSDLFGHYVFDSLTNWRWCRTTVKVPYLFSEEPT